MRTKLCQINWHPSERDGGKNAPIMATDFAPVPHHATRPSIPSDPSTAVRIVATASQDGTVRLWKLNAAPAPTTASSSSSSSSSTTTDGFHVDYVLDFEGHQMSVNAVRFSPNGECIATGGDDGYVIVWYMTTQPMDTSIKAATSWHEVETPRQLQRVILRGKLSEICDLSWTHDSKYIVTGSVDGTVGVWDVNASKLCHQLKDHKGFVQGVATDPRGEYFTSQCASRTCRIHKVDMTKVTPSHFYIRHLYVPVGLAACSSFFLVVIRSCFWHSHSVRADFCYFVLLLLLLLLLCFFFRWAPENGPFNV